MKFIIKFRLTWLLSDKYLNAKVDNDSIIINE